MSTNLREEQQEQDASKGLDRDALSPLRLLVPGGHVREDAPGEVRGAQAVDKDDVAVAEAPGNLVNRDLVNRNLVNRDLVNRDLVNRDLVNWDLVKRDTVNRDLVKRDTVNRDLVKRDVVNWDSVD